MNKKDTLREELQQDSALDLYLKNGFPNVQGWCNHRIFSFLKYISDVQKANQITGGACEIGVHHGKFFIGLHNLITQGELSLALDIFDNQKLNIDKSGKGDLEQFEININSFATRPESIQVMAKDSTTLSIKDLWDLESSLGKFRFFSIDGGHTVEHTVNDFKVAQQLICNGGLVIVDDYLNQNWPGVSEGIARLFLLDSPKLIPFMIGAGKLVFTTISFYQKYLKLSLEWATNRKSDSFKRVLMYGYDVVSWIPSK